MISQKNRKKSSKKIKTLLFFILVASYLIVLISLRFKSTTIDRIIESYRNSSLYFNETISNDGSIVAEPSQPKRFKYVRIKNSSYKLKKPNESKEIDEKREVIKAIMLRCWRAYSNKHWGRNDIRIRSDSFRRINLDFHYPDSNQSLTIVDALDTLLLMNLKEEYQIAREWILKNFSFIDSDQVVPILPTITNLVGGLLSSFAITGDIGLLRKAHRIASSILPALQNSCELSNLFFIPNGKKPNAEFYEASLADLGSFYLEFKYLSDMTGDWRFQKRAFQIRSKLLLMRTENNTFYANINVKKCDWINQLMTTGKATGRFYDCLLKSFIQSNNTDYSALKWFLFSVLGMESNRMIMRTESGDFLYLTESKFGHNNQFMEHYSCFVPGLLKIAVKHLQKLWDQNHQYFLMNEFNRKILERMDSIAADLVETCFHAYNSTYSKLGADFFYFGESMHFTQPEGTFNDLSPEYIESLFYMWRLTKDPNIVNMLGAMCKRSKINRRPRMPSFFLGATLKYLYLIFSNDAVFSLDRWIFNAAGHPLPICDKNDAYPLKSCTSKFYF
ncbi:Mannosyl-oligosaccharide 1, 2-alpha-mannosidase C52E4.5 [Sarcoptes scabiei]|uniref:alpha-1,2-Mannosidase n=1 Tax=Sarcoptes scabiei TaxID=52283 RepID=A0A834V837_SARSC|nr:Mannosyl-oligosaccharide 1, 2-alpha-mannosidase C52E4.5 [Sarcoptes scabiei]